MSTYLLEKNMCMLKSYQYYNGPDFTDYHDMKSIDRNFGNIYNIDNDIIKINDKIMLINIVIIDDIIKIEKASYFKYFYEWKKMPLYLYYDEEYFFYMLKNFDLNQLIIHDRMVFIIGKGKLKEYFLNMQSILPLHIIGFEHETFEIEIEHIMNHRENILMQARLNINTYYSENSETIMNNIKSGSYRILFITTRFLGYRYLRDLYEGSIEAGYNSYLAIEDNNISRLYYELFIDQYKPDIIFALNTFRFEIDFIPQEPIFVTWIVDRYKNIFCKETPQKLGCRDVVCNAVINDNRLWYEYGYDKDSLIDLVYPGNNHIYKKYDISEKEYSKYKCDIVLVSNNTDFEKFINQTIKEFPENYCEFIHNMAYDYYSLEYNEKGIYGHDQIKQYIIDWMVKSKLNLSDTEFEDVFVRFLLIRYFARKLVLVRWLFEPQKYDIKLWGLDWADMPEFSAYGNGPAPNGETLSKIYQCAKIAIATQPDITYPSRVAEITLSGAFALLGHIPVEYDIIPCDRFMKLGSDIACYYSKQDLYEKLDYYLSHDKDREAMIRHTKQIIMEKLIVKQQAMDTFNRIEQRYSKI